MAIISVTVQLWIYLGVLGYIVIVEHKENSPDVLSIPPGTPCIYIIVQSNTNFLSSNHN